MPPPERLYLAEHAVGAYDRGAVQTTGRRTQSTGAGMVQSARTRLAGVRAGRVAHIGHLGTLAERREGLLGKHEHRHGARAEKHRA